MQVNDMDKKCLPGDIQKYIRKKFFLRVFKFVFLEMLAVSFIAFQHKHIFEIAGRMDLIISSIVLILLPFLITGIPFKLIDSTWCGIVVDIKVTTSMDFVGRFYATNSVRGMYYKNTIHLKVKKDNQKIVDVKALELGVQNSITTLFFDGVIFGRLDDHIDNFQIGDVVYHFYGLKRPYIIHKKQKKFTYCVICGYRNFSEENICSGCGHSLIKYSNNENAPT